MTSREELIGYHKGAIATLLKERQELIRLLNIVDQLLNAHVAELKKLGIDITKEAEKQEKRDVKDLLE